MPGAAVGAFLGWAFTGFAAMGTTISFLGMSMTAFGVVMMGASLGSLFDAPSLDMGGATPNYNFGPLSNSKTQLLPVPICYGRVRVGGNVFLQRFHDDKKEKMDMMVGLSEGPINRVVSVMANEHVLWGEGSKEVTYWIMEVRSGKDAPPPEWKQVSRTEWEAWTGHKEIRDAEGKAVELDLKECSCDVYLGESGQAPDPRSIGSLPYDKLAYVAVTLKAQEGLPGNPTIVTVLEGRKVWTPSGVRYTRNPAWIVWDLLTNSDYGVGIPAEHLDPSTFEAVAAVCDQPVDGEPRYTLDYIIDQQRPAIDILRDMLACFRGFFICRERIELHVDREVTAPYKAIGPDQIVLGSLQVWQAPADDVPNRLLIEWVDPENYYERSTAVFENQPDLIRRGVVEKQVSMLGITSASQVSRMGGYLLVAGQDIREFCSFGLCLQDADVEVGDVISLTSDWAGYSGKWFRVLTLEDSGSDDTIRVTCAEYSSTAYAASPIDFVHPKPDIPLTNYDDIHNLVLSLEGHVEEDGTWFPAIGVKWGNPTTWTPESIEVQLRHRDDPENQWILHAAMPGTAMGTLISSGLRTSQTVTVWVRAKGKDGRVSTGQMESILLEKDTIPPGPVTGLATEGWFGSVWLTWINPTDSDLSHVEIWECDHDARADAVKVAEVRGTSYNRHLGSFQGRYYWVRAVDYSGNVSQWNAETGVYGYSDMANAEDFWNELLKHTEVGEAVEWLNGHIDSLAESHIKTILADADESWKAVLEQRKQEKLAELQITGSLASFDDYRWSLAAITEEKETRESEDEALARWVRSVEAMIGDPANPGEGTVFAALREELEARARADEALSRKVTTLEATIGDPWNPGEGTVYAALRDEKNARVTKDEAISQDVQTLVAGIGDPMTPAPGTVYSVIAEERSTRAAADSALAEKVTTVQTQIDGNMASIRQILSSVDGIKAQWGVLTDINGRVAGLTMLSGQSHTAMIFRVDSFIVDSPDSYGGIPPFMIGTVDGRTRTVIRDAFIQDAAISSAKIKDLTIGRIKLASGPSAGLSWGYSNYSSTQQNYPGGTNGWVTPAGGDVSVPTESRGRTLVHGFIRCTHWYGSVEAGLFKNGALVQHIGGSGGGSYDPASSLLAYYVDQSPANGTSTYEMRLRGTGESVTKFQCGISAVTFYR